MDEAFFHDDDEIEGSDSSYLRSLNGVVKAGYRDGKLILEEEVRQKSFDEGLETGILLGKMAGQIFGLARKAQIDSPCAIAVPMVENLSRLLLKSLANVAVKQPPLLVALQEMIVKFPTPVQSAYKRFEDKLKDYMASYQDVSDAVS